MYQKFALNDELSGPQYGYTPNGVTRGTATQRLLAAKINAEVAIWRTNGWYLRSASVSKDNQKAVLLLNGLSENSEIEPETQSSLVFIDIHTTSAIRFACTAASKKEDAVRNSPSQMDSRFAAPVSSPPANNLNISFEERDGIGYWKISPAGNPIISGQVVFLRGGSAASVYDLPLSNLEKLYLSKRFEIFRVEYSGAVGASIETFSRLLANRDRALETDGAKISNYIEQHSSNLPVVLIADSFGSVLAGHLVKLRPQAFAKVIVTSPLLKWHPSRDYSTDNSAEFTNQTIFDRWTYGAPMDQTGADINESLARSIGYLCNAENTVVIIGANDQLSRATDWLEKCKKTGTLISMPDHGHDVIDSPEVVRFLEEASVSTPPLP
jgi:hypothetical protein